MVPATQAAVAAVVVVLYRLVMAAMVALAL
jgi:hypothetical protein